MVAFSLLFLLVLLPAAVGLVLGHSDFFGRPIFRRRLRAGAPIVYRVQETSTHPSADALDVFPSRHGEFYDYLAKKYWRVEEVLQDGSIVALTPLMEHHHLQCDDPNLRKANFIERLRYAARFPSPAYR